MATPYLQIPEDVATDCNDSQPVAMRRSWKKGTALSVCCLVVVAIVTASKSMPTLRSNSAAESISLLGFSPSLRSPFGAKNGIVKPMGQQGVYSKALDMSRITSNPLAKLAITGIEANHLDYLGVRGVSMNAQMKTVLASMDEPAKKEVEEAVDAAADKVELAKLKAKKAKDFAGVTAPLGYWDPFGFSARVPSEYFAGAEGDWDVELKVPEARFLFLREAELKHGRVCMLASLGILVSERFHPLFGGDIDVPAYKAFQETPLQTFWIAVLAAIGFLETPSIKSFTIPSDGSNAFSLRAGRVAGDLGFDPLGLKPKDEKEFKNVQTKEINNGRLAMIATAGMIAQELVDGEKIFK